MHTPLNGNVISSRRYEFKDSKDKEKQVKRVEITLLTEEGDVFRISTPDEGQSLPAKGAAVDVEMKIVPDWATMKPTLKVIAF